MFRIHSIHLVSFAYLLLVLSCNHTSNKLSYKSNIVPVIEGEWWEVTGNPDLGSLSTERQQPVDFGIWQAADSSWQIWSCIRQTREPGNTRLFYRWEGKTIEQEDWQPMGIAMQADSTLGETPGGLQAPYVIYYSGKYYMFYGDWAHICLAESEDGKNFKRVMRDGSPELFGDKSETNTRDPMLLHHDDTWYCYYTAHPNNDGAIFLRTSYDLFNWSSSKIVSYGGSPGKGELWYAECPHVIEYPENNFFLFRTFSYGRYQSGVMIDEPKTNVYRSADLYDFGIDNDKYLLTQLSLAAPEIIKDNEKWYIAALKPDLQGIRIARMVWEEATIETSPVH